MQTIQKSSPAAIDYDAFTKQGFIVAALDIGKELEVVRREVFSVFNWVRMQTASKPVQKDKDIIDFYHEDQPMQFQALKLCWGLPSVLAIGNNSRILEALKALGLKHPRLDLPPVLRCDMPVEKQSMFHQHQDYTWNQGSQNSMTAWIPLESVIADEGALKVAAGSHKNGVYPHENGITHEKYKFDFISQPVKFGEALIFNQKIIHASGRNISQKIRFSFQLRYSDIECPAYSERHWPINHLVTTERFAEPTVG